VIGSAARAAFQQMRGVPHLAVRVNDALVEEVDGLIQKVARECGFEGRLLVLGEPEIALGDVRFEWADGGVTRQRARIDEALAQTFSALADTSSTGFDP
jgi:flagellar assembly protein FliH